jgi:dolichol-phosphate mannosyltransferase
MEQDIQMEGVLKNLIILGVYGWGVLRKLISRGANFFASFFLRSSISDMTGSFRIYRKSLFQNLTKGIKNNGFAFMMEIMIRAKELGSKIEEIPITFVDRLMGKSKIEPREIVIYFWSVVKLYFTL